MVDVAKGEADAVVSTSEGDSPGVEPTPSPTRDAFAVRLAWVAFAGFLGRLIYTVLLRDRTLWVDSMAYHFRAQDLADGYGFVLPARQILEVAVTNPPDAGMPPLWSLTLAVPTALGMRSLFQQQLAMVLLGTATIVMTGLAGRAVFGRRVGLIAAALVAVYPNIWLYEREILSEPLAMFEVALMILVSYRFLARPSTRLAIALGALCGILALTRAEQIMLAPLLVMPLILSVRSRSLLQRFGWLVLAGTACVMVIAPWTAYNWNRFEQPVLLSNGFGQALRAGNCDRTYHGELLGYVRSEFLEQGNEKGCSILEDTYADDQSLVEDQLRRAAFDYMGDNLNRVPVVVAARIGRTFNVYRPFQQIYFEGERNTPVPVLRAALFSFWLLVPLAAVGVVAARRRRIPVYPIIVYFLVVTLAVALTIGAVRYRAPAEVPLVLLAAVGIDHLVIRSRARRRIDPTIAHEPVGAVT